MENAEKQKSEERVETPNLKGTLLSVLLLGVFIIVSWFGVFALFLSR
ncbi:MAG: cytochrome c oxidase subunit 2A [Bacillota bacterium]|uniref:Cytochrome c oxidase subunit 2A n=1 Tax=Virgibacillus salarius TaxID=447199 RepID=A0A941E078_9BACI|nr:MULTISPECIES: cytochrome c oxidase subunit 2A [Bacillaceae]NAZ09277.1 cytochrome c oxidase subunit 2A [Agaribacter marinus]MBR7796568.1 cytochrome c oxidase subunit 2A [Virgibacillus salarius]MCC2250893.1 cytochrome c oxidase subunit 2A [Virgibacillus sp. AGTR]MDY7042597.1 cytochrome c oxidase subunit 2A [Virgibacillus sp. M23]QRZ17066.1 cytochrome c oxidase subunit 2A [Virgibacillus sp. AGTR]